MIGTPGFPIFSLKILDKPPYIAYNIYPFALSQTSNLLIFQDKENMMVIRYRVPKWMHKCLIYFTAIVMPIATGGMAYLTYDYAKRAQDPAYAIMCSFYRCNYAKDALECGLLTVSLLIMTVVFYANFKQLIAIKEIRKEYY